MLDLVFPSLVDIHVFSILEDIFVIMMLYVLIKLLLLCALVELVWPTHFFNKRNLTAIVFFKVRSFVEVVSKLQMVGIVALGITLSV